MAEAYHLNAPLAAVQESSHKGTLPQEKSFVRIDKENVFVEAVKLAEDSDDVIIRVVDHYCSRGKVTLEFDDRIKAVKECDLMEENDKPVSFENNKFTFYIKPYEIKTFKVKL